MNKPLAVDARKTNDQKVEELQQALQERATELEVMTRELEKFSYSVSHDLRAPLRAIEGFSKILLEDYLGKLDEEGQRYLKIIDASSRKMSRLLDDLLLLSRLGRQETNFSRVNMREIVDSVWEELRPRSRKIDLVIKSLPDGWGDTILLQQIWKQLLGNAVKFTASKDQAAIEISGKKEPSRMVYCVKDNGVGFNMNSASKLFGVFQRLHTPEEFEGNGIGLAIVQRLVRRQSGEVWTEAKPGEGASFYFSLPFAANLVRSTTNSEKQIEQFTGK